MSNAGWDMFCAALDGKFEQSADVATASYDPDSDMVIVEENLMLPLPVYNYAQYIKRVRRFRETLISHLIPDIMRTTEFCCPLP